MPGSASASGATCCASLDVWSGRIQRPQWTTRIDGIEIDPNRVQPHAHHLHSNVYIGDIREEVPRRARDTAYEIILFGDVIEHVPKSDGIALPRRRRRSPLISSSSAFRSATAGAWKAANHRTIIARDGIATISMAFLRPSASTRSGATRPGWSPSKPRPRAAPPSSTTSNASWRASSGASPRSPPVFPNREETDRDQSGRDAHHQGHQQLQHAVQRLLHRAVGLSQDDEVRDRPACRPRVSRFELLPERAVRLAWWRASPARTRFLRGHPQRAAPSAHARQFSGTLRRRTPRASTTR